MSLDCSESRTERSLRGAAVPAATFLLLVSSALARAEDLAQLWEAARQGGEYQSPGKEELSNAEGLFQRTLDGKEDTDALGKAWRGLGFELTAAAVGREKFLVLHELPDHKTGRGFYLFRQGPAPAIALQAPHGTDDLHTGSIALSLFEQGGVRAGAWNTARRSGGDLAHLPASYLQAFTRAFATTHRRGVLVQLHGFETSKRTSEAGAAADMIVSNGTREPPLWLRAVARGFREGVARKVKVYPNDIKELGGTTNAQANLLRDLGHDGFLHVEMSQGLRKQLRDDQSLREVFLKCLTEVYRKERE